MSDDERDPGARADAGAGGEGNRSEFGKQSTRGAQPSEVLEVRPVRHEQAGTFLVTCAFGISLLGGIGFVFGYWTGASTQWLGGTMALFLGGLGIASVLWSHLLTLVREVVEPREHLDPPPAEREGAVRDFNLGADQIHRRGLLMWMAAGAFGIVGAIVVSLFRSLGTPPGNTLYSSVWKRGQRLVTAEGKPINVNSLEPGSTTIVFPEDSIGSERAQTVLLRVKEDLLQLPSERQDWAPLGNLAFSRVCTHAGCTVGLYEKNVHLLTCPCHQSTFDVLRAAKPTGGPADRPLPQLPLYADADGTLRAGGGFSEPPGPGFWGMP